MHEIEIQFYRTKQNARKLKGIVENFTNYELAQDVSDPCTVTINKGYNAEDLRSFAHFWGIVKKYKTTAMLVDGRMLTAEQSCDIIDWINCYNNKAYFDDEPDYCCITPGMKELVGWGCKNLRSITRHGKFGRYNGLPWHEIGPFEDGVKYIDKQAIKDKLTAEAADKGLQLCPMFSLTKMRQLVDTMPDQIDPRIDTQWEYQVSDDEVNKGEVIGVQPEKIDILEYL